MTPEEDFEIVKQKCEICGKPAKCGLNDGIDFHKIRFSCQTHVLEIWNKMRSENPNTI